MLPCYSVIVCHAGNLRKLQNKRFFHKCFLDFRDNHFYDATLVTVTRNTFQPAALLMNVFTVTHRLRCRDLGKCGLVQSSFYWGKAAQGKLKQLCCTCVSGISLSLLTGQTQQHLAPHSITKTYNKHIKTC